MITEGTRVKVVDSGLAYSTYLAFLAEYQSNIGNENLKKFRLGTAPAEGEEFTVVFMAHHPDVYEETICVIVNDTNLFMIGCDGLVEIESIQVGDKVVITDTGGLYTTYEKFILRHKNQLKSEDFWHFKYGLDLPSCVENVKVFKVLCIDYHGEAWAKDRLIAIVREEVDGHVFLIDVESLKRVD